MRNAWITKGVSLVVGLSLLLSSVVGYYSYTNKVTQEVYRTEMNQIVSDEGFSKCVYKDSLGLRTIGFGHLITKGESFRCINLNQAFNILRDDYYIAVESVEDRYPWAEGEVKLVLINMTFQLGEYGLSLFKRTLKHLKDEKYNEATIEMLDSTWARQTPQRAVRLAVRILEVQE